MTMRRGAGQLGEWADPRRLAALVSTDARLADKLTGQRHEKFHRDVCQCCGFRDTDGNEACVCAGLDWYMVPGGGVECQAHKFARAIGQGKKRFSFFRGGR